MESANVNVHGEERGRIRQLLLRLIPEADRPRVRSRWRRAVEEDVSYRDTYQAIGADGKPHWYLARGEPFPDESAQILH